MYILFHINALIWLILPPKDIMMPYKLNPVFTNRCGSVYGLR